MNMSEIIKKLLHDKCEINPYNSEHMKLIKLAYGKYYTQKLTYEKMYRYYKGNTDSIQNYKFITDRSNIKVSANYMKKFIKEEVSYTVGNTITYESRLGVDSVISDIGYYTSHWDELHDSDLMKYLLIFTKVYELYYIDNKEFCSKIIKPTEGYAYTDANGKVLFFIRTYKNDFDNTQSYIDLYTRDKIYHYDSHFNEIYTPTENIFGEVPVTVGQLTYEGHYDSVYNDIKGLQDAFETNLSDIGNEIADFRNAYLKFIGCQISEEDLPKMKELGVLNLKDNKGSIEWLIKNINDTFIQNTLDRYLDTMYQVCCHINHNERMQSNLSGVALRSRLIALENKCELEQKAHSNMVKNRLKFLFKYLDFYLNKKYDYKDIKLIYTPNIPQDDLSTAQMLSQLGEGIISKDTARGLFSFISNTVVEKEKVEKEESYILEGSKLLDGGLNE